MLEGGQFSYQLDERHSADMLAVVQKELYPVWRKILICLAPPIGATGVAFLMSTQPEIAPELYRLLPSFMMFAYLGVVSVYVAQCVPRPSYTLPEGPFRGEHHFSYDEEGFSVESKHSRTELKWAIIRGVAIRGKTICLRFDKINAVAVARDAFETREDEQAFISFVDRRIASSQST